MALRCVLCVTSVKDTAVAANILKIAFTYKLQRQHRIISTPGRSNNILWKLTTVRSLPCNLEPKAQQV